MKKKKSWKEDKHRVYRKLKKTPNPNLPGKEVGRKGFLKMVTPETNLK